MWKKTEVEQSQPPVAGTVSRPQPTREQAIIGASLVVKGDVEGDEDLTIQGRVEGKVVLKKNSITVGRNGRVKADLYGREICVEGLVEGNLFAEERIVLRQTGQVKGNLKAPRVSLEDGARFKGSIDMDVEEKAPAEERKADAPSPKEGPEKKPASQGQLRLDPPASAKT